MGCPCVGSRLSHTVKLVVLKSLPVLAFQNSTFIKTKTTFNKRWRVNNVAKAKKNTHTQRHKTGAKIPFYRWKIWGTGGGNGSEHLHLENGVIIWAS